MPKLRILVTAGPTREYLDPVRFLSNASSGKLGYAIAAAARRRGHEVVLISGPVALDAPRGVRVIRVVSAEEMLRAARTEFRRCHAAVFAAAVCDHRPAVRSPRKLPKRATPRSLPLKPNPDIAAILGRAKRNRVTIGFALEDQAGRTRAAEKLAIKRFDAILLNGPENIGADQARFLLLKRGKGWTPWNRSSKAVAGGGIVRLIEALVLKGHTARRRTRDFP